MTPTRAMSHRKLRSGCDETAGCDLLPPMNCGPYILIAPNVAVIVICDTASKLGSALSVERMCLFPKRVAPLHRYHKPMKKAVLANRETGCFGCVVSSLLLPEGSR